LREYVLGGAADLAALEQELRDLEHSMGEGAHDQATMRRYSEAIAQLEHAGGWDWRSRTAAVVRGLGFTDDDLDRRLATFSGGELTRASLGRALAGDPDLLLLDEPTNHLDVANLEWLETTLASLDAAVVLVAHDRWFLEAVTTAVLELEGGRSLYFAGPWHEWRRERAARALAAGKAVQRYDADLARLERFVERFRYKKSKAKQAQAKLTQIGRLAAERSKSSAELDALTLRGRTLGFEFLDPPRSGKTVVDVTGMNVTAGDKRLLDDVSVAIDRGEHVALVGPNGSGKTTLLTTLLARQLGYGVVPAYFSQQETELDERGTVLDCVQSMTGLTRPNAQNLLGRFLFSGWEEHQKAVSVLSGGERRRLALATVVASGANFLVLDEPTNHLDLESREALEDALRAFPGTVLLVSHDRALLDAIAHRTLAIENRRLEAYDGGWADYVRRRDDRLVEREAPAPKERKAKPAPAPRRPKRPRELQELEAEIEAKEQAVADLERRLADDWADVDTVAAYRREREELESLFARWETLVESAQA
jgi:ATP-binding cassette subfamily F protein 3